MKTYKRLANERLIKHMNEDLIQRMDEGLIKRQAGVDLRSKIEAWIKEHEQDFKRSGVTAEIGGDLSVEVNVKNDIFLYINLFPYKKDLRENYEVPDYIHFKKAVGKHIVLNHLNVSNWATVLDKFDVTDMGIENSNIADEDVQGMMPEGEFNYEICGCDKVVNPKFQKKHLTSFVKFSECKNLSSITLQGCRGEYTQLWVRYCPKFSEIKVIGKCKRLHRVLIDGTQLAKDFEQELTSTYPRTKFKELKIEVEKLPMFKELIEKFPDLSMLTTDNYIYEKKFNGSWVVKPSEKINK